MNNPVVEIPNEISVNETKVLSFGELLVGIEFNTANEDKVAKVKKLMAEAANILKDSYTNDESRGPVKSLLFDHAVGELVSAQMAVVKVITYK